MVDLGATLCVATWLTIPNSEKILSLSSVASKALYLRSKKARKGLALCFLLFFPVSNSTWGRMDESPTSPPFLHRYSAVTIVLIVLPMGASPTLPLECPARIVMRPTSSRDRTRKPAHEDISFHCFTTPPQCTTDFLARAASCTIQDRLNQFRSKKAMKASQLSFSGDGSPHCSNASGSFRCSCAVLFVCSRSASFEIKLT